MPDEGGFEIARAYMTVDADTGEATAEVDELEERAAELHGTLTIDADTAEADAKIDVLEERIANLNATATVDADTAPAEASVAGLEAQLDDLDGTATVTADTAPAEAGLELVDEKLKEIDAAAGAVTVGANIAPAEAALDGLHGQIDATTGSVKVGADIAPAQAELAVLEGEIEGVKASADDLDFSGAAGSAGEMAERLEAGAGAASQIAGDLGPLAGGAGDVDSALTGAGNAASSFGQQAMAASEDIDDLIGRFQAAATEFHEIDQVANLPGMSSLGSQIQSLAQDLDAVGAHGGATADELEGLELRLDEIGDSLDRAHAHALQFGNGIESVSADLSRSGGLYDGVAAEIDRVAEGADDAGDSFLRARTGASLLDDAMVNVHDKMQDAWDAATALNLSLSQTENIGPAASDALKELGASELQAAAGANALVKAQRDFDELTNGGGGGGFGGGILNLLGGGGEEGGSLGSALAGVGALSAGIGVAYAFAGAMAEVGGLVTGVSAAFTGLVPAVALAIPSVEKIAKAFKDTQSQLDKLPPAERGTIEGIKELKSEYDKMAASFAPDVFKIFDEGVKVANNLLKESKPLADAAAKGVDGLLKEADKFTKSQGFKQWLKQITPDIAPSIKAIGTTIGTIALDWGKFMKTFTPKDIQNTFHILDNLINWWSTGWIHIIKNVMNMWDDFSAAFKNSKNWFDDAFGALKVGFFGAEAIAVTAGHDIEHVWDDIKQKTGQYWHDIAHAVSDGIDGARESVITAGHAIESAWDESLSTIESSAKQDWHDVSQDVSDALDTIREGVITAAHDIESAWDSSLSTIVSDARTGWDDVDHATSAALDDVRETVVSAGHDIEAAFDTAIHDVESAWNAGVSDVEHITSTLVHDIESAFTALPGELEHLGEEAIEGLAHGIEDAAGDVLSAIGHIASSIPSSLGKLLDMGSPSRVLRALGHDTMEGYRLGILDYEDPIAAAMRKVGSTAVSAGATAFSSAGAPVAVHGSIAPTAERAGGANVTVNLNGIMTFPNPEQVHAMQMALATAVGVSG